MAGPRFHGWRWDSANSRLQVNIAGTDVAYLDANGITTASGTISNGVVQKGGIATGQIKTAVVAGAAAGDVTVTGIATGDELVGVIRLDRDATAANINISSLLSEFTISAANTINNAAGTSTSGDALLVI